MSSDGRKVGDIVDYVFNTATPPHLAYVLVMTGGFLEMGGDVRAVPASALTLSGDTARIQLASDRYFSLPVLPADRVGFLADARNADSVARQFGVAPEVRSSSTQNMQGKTSERASLVTFTDLRNEDVYSTDGGRLGFVVDSWISLNRDRAPYLEIVPTFRPFRTPNGRRYAIPLSKLADTGGPGLNFNITSNDLANANSVSETEGVQMLDNGQLGQMVLRVTLPRVATASSGHRANMAASRNPGANQDSTRDSTGGYGDHHNLDARQLTIASANAADSGVRHLAGQHVRSSDNRDLGTLKDFLVDTQTGKVQCAVISSGGFLGAGDKLRVVPAGALEPSSNGFTLPVAQSQWNRVPTINEDGFEHGKVSLNESDRQTLAQIFQQQKGASGFAQDSGNNSASVLRASELRGKGVRNGDQDVGNIEEIVIDLRNDSATALLDPNSDFTGNDQKYLVPLAALQITTREEDPVTTTLTRADFQNASGAGSTARMNSSSSGQSLSATGSSSAAQNPPANAKVSMAAQSVRRALDHNSSLSRADITVVPQNDNVVLRGSVANDSLRDQAENTAEHAANGVEVDNQITVSGK